MKSTIKHTNTRHAAHIAVALVLACAANGFAGQDCSDPNGPTPPPSKKELGTRESKLAEQFLPTMTAYGQTIAGIKATGRASQGVAVTLPTTAKAAALAAAPAKKP